MNIIKENTENALVLLNDLLKLGWCPDTIAVNNRKANAVNVHIVIYGKTSPEVIQYLKKNGYKSTKLDDGIKYVNDDFTRVILYAGHIIW